eukprot:Phypoly_transcript_11238.p1 GENE.Phypoly_transcript_11238~~Phypoly_transcript_11238.p1  ORF type:complete len:359 (+),score=68.29 Phypoly_transcript_11238:102-1178(+)
MEATYEDKLILAPMVRMGTLPFRLLSAECGADLTYSEELVALKLMKATRVVNEKTNTIDFVAPDKSIAYQTSKNDTNNIAQIGAANATTALAAATVIAKDVVGIDLNCGCPKHFSVQGGMGAALLKTPETIEDIVKTLSNNIDKPITLKIRLLEKDSDTVEIIRRAEHVGARAVGIHARFVHERPRDRAHWDRLTEVIEFAGASVSVPLIANGDIHNAEDVAKVKQIKGISSVMIARGAINDASIFAKAKKLLPNNLTDEKDKITPFRIFDTKNELVKRYLEHALTTNNNLPNTKYCLKTMIEVPGGFNGPSLPPDQDLWNQVNSAKTYSDLCTKWNVNTSVENLQCQDKDPDADPER